jgi:hypothetical protein
MRSTHNYYSFMLRLWTEDTPGQWRGCLQSISSGQTHYFHNLCDLFLYLHSQVQSIPFSDLSSRDLPRVIPKMDLNQDS